MTQAQIEELFGVSSSTFKDWKNKPDHTKRNLALFLKSLNYQEAKSSVNKILKDLDKK